ncbi:hypothetical protein BGX34_008343 [Mortierella sp. NVP85]|nr:hypothetical protein BGX34_008343 [Mortierella sp. NVP85]
MSLVSSMFSQGTADSMVNALVMTLRDRNTPFPRIWTRSQTIRHDHAELREEIDQFMHELFALGPAVGQCRLVSEFFGVYNSDLEAQPQADDRDVWCPVNGTQVTMLPASVTLLSPTQAISPSSAALPVPKSSSIEEGNGLLLYWDQPPRPVDHNVCPTKSKFELSESPSSSPYNSDDSYGVEDSDTDCELIPVCSADERSDTEGEPKRRSKRVNKRSSIPVVKNSISLQNLREPSRYEIAQEGEQHVARSLPSSSAPVKHLERQPRIRHSRGSKSKRFGNACIPPIPALPITPTQDGFGSPTTTTHCFAEGEVVHSFVSSNRSYFSYDDASSRNPSPEPCVTRARSCVTARSRPSSLNPESRQRRESHGNALFMPPSISQDTDVKKQQSDSKPRERTSRTPATEHVDPSYQKPSTRSRMKAAAALVTPVQIPKIPVDCQKSPKAPLSAGPVLMTPRSSSLANLMSPTLSSNSSWGIQAAPGAMSNKAAKKASKNRSRPPKPIFLPTNEMVMGGRTPRLRSMSSPMNDVNATEAKQECTKATKRGSSSTPSSPMTVSPSSFGSQCAAQEGGRRMRGDPNCRRCHGQGVIREPEQPDHLDMGLVSSLNQAPTPFQRHPPSAFVATFKIVCDSKHIVALRVMEQEHDFALSAPDLRRRVQKKLAKMEIPLPEQFELIWTPSCGEGGSSVVLKNDEELRRAIQSNPHQKITLQCLY